MTTEFNVLFPGDEKKNYLIRYPKDLCAILIFYTCLICLYNNGSFDFVNRRKNAKICLTIEKSQSTQTI